MTIKKLIIPIGGLGYETLLNWYKNNQIEDLKKGGSDILFLDTHENQFYQPVLLEVDKLGANTHGAGGDFDSGTNKFQNIKDKVSDLISEYDFILIIAGFGGGTGSSFTDEIIKICKDKNKTNFVITNTPRKDFESDYKTSLNNFQYMIEVMNQSNPYIVIKSSSVKEQLINYNKAWTDYESYFSCICYNFIQTIGSMLQSGIDIADMNKTIFTNGEKIINISFETDLDKTVIQLKNDYYSIGRFEDCSCYTLLVPRGLSEKKYQSLIYKIEYGQEIRHKKIRPIDTDFCVLIGDLTQADTNQAYIDTAFNINKKIDFKANKDTLTQDDTVPLVSDTKDFVSKLANQDFLTQLFLCLDTLQTHNVDTVPLVSDTSTGVKANWINLNIFRIQEILKISPDDKPITRDMVRRYLENNKIK